MTVIVLSHDSNCTTRKPQTSTIGLLQREFVNLYPRSFTCPERTDSIGTIKRTVGLSNRLTENFHVTELDTLLSGPELPQVEIGKHSLTHSFVQIHSFFIDYHSSRSS